MRTGSHFWHRLRFGPASLIICCVGCGAPDRPSLTDTTEPAAPVLAAVLPGVVSPPGVSRAYLTFAPDGETLYLARYTQFGGDGLVSVEVARRQSGVWSEPRTAPFSGTFHDHQPQLSPDGRFLYFVSKRPVDDVPRDDYELWRIEIRGDDFGEPEHLAELGGPSNEYAPFVGPSGRIYFSSDRGGGLGSGDLYVAEPEGDRFGAPRNLGAPVNGGSGEWGSTLDETETLLVFESSGRAENLSASGDLYFSRRIDGVWSEPRHFAAPINSAGSDLAPRISHDGRTLLFSTNRDGVVATFEVDLVAALADFDP